MEDYRHIVAHYEACLREHGDTHRGVDWPNAADAETRYRVMSELVLPHGEPVQLLDFGCGASHLYEYLHRHRRTDIVYTGLDLSPEFVALSRRKFPHLTYFCGDVLKEDQPLVLPQFDYVVMNGVFTEKRSLSFEAMWQHCQAVIARVFPLVRLGMAFNVMSWHVDWQREDLFHLPFDMLAAFLKEHVSRHFQFRSDYGLYEYTTYVYRKGR